MRDLTKLVHPFPARLIHTNPSGGGVYVKHGVVAQRMLDVIGPHDFEMVEVIRGHVAGRKPNPQGKSQRARDGVAPLDDAVVGVVARLRCEIDGRTVVVEEAGDCEEPHNWPHDGARMKDAMSDAYKRAAMRLGVGLHLWTGDDFYLAAKLLDQDKATEADAASEPAS